jgi:hypothetical protein
MTTFHCTESLSSLFFDETLTVLGTAAYWWLTQILQHSQLDGNAVVKPLDEIESQFNKLNS